jgi:integrase
LGDIDFESGLITIQAFNTKTARERTVAITTRLMSELEQLRAQAPDDPNVRVFGIEDNVKRSFCGARADAELNDVRFTISATLTAAVWTNSVSVCLKLAIN